MDRISIPIIADPVSGALDSERVVSVWFELILETKFGWGTLEFGPANVNRRCAPSTTIQCSDVYDPFPDLARIAKHTFLGRLPVETDVDSAGPETRIRVQQGPSANLALVTVHDIYDAVIHFAAVVARDQFGLALGHCLRSALLDPTNVPAWNSWYGHWPLDDSTESRAAFFGSEWLRNLSD